MAHILLLHLFWRALLGVRSAICRHQLPQKAVLNQVDCFVQCEVVRSKISLKGRDLSDQTWNIYSSASRATKQCIQLPTLTPAVTVCLLKAGDC